MNLFVALALSASTGVNSLSGAHNMAGCYSTVEAATKSAEKNCASFRTKEGTKSADCKTLAVSPVNGCVALAYDPTSQFKGGGVGSGGTEDEAGQAATKMCNDSSCKVQVSYCCQPQPSENAGYDAGYSGGVSYGTNRRWVDCAYYPSMCYYH